MSAGAIMQPDVAQARDTPATAEVAATCDVAALRARLNRLCGALASDLVEREPTLRLVLLATLAGEHTLLVGPPGTAKSALARRIHRAFAQREGYFERLLTRFSVPEELFGPLSIQALEEDRYERQIEGYLPTASLAFLDEIFKANSAILNALLTLLNEREYDHGRTRIRTPLMAVIGASNDWPRDPELHAFADRFLLWLPVRPVSNARFADLLANPSDGADWVDGASAAGMRPDAGTAGTRGGNEIMPLDAETVRRLWERAATIPLPEALVRTLGALRAHIQEGGFAVSDRRWKKIAALLRMAAASDGRDCVSVWDLGLVPPCIPDADAQVRAAQWLLAALGLAAPAPLVQCGRLVLALEKQLEIEQNAEDLDYDSEGRLNFGGSLDDSKHASNAPRLAYTRRRHYGPLHIGARVAQCEAEMCRLTAVLGQVEETAADLVRIALPHLWLPHGWAQEVSAVLGATAEAIRGLTGRLEATARGYADLPRRDGAPGNCPEPVVAPEPVPINDGAPAALAVSAAPATPRITPDAPDL